MRNKKYLLLLLPLALLFLSEKEEVTVAVSPETMVRIPASTQASVSQTTIPKTTAPKEFTFRERNLKATLAVYKKMQRYPSTTQPIAIGSMVDPIAKRISPVSSRQLSNSKDFYEIETSIEKQLLTPQDKTLSIKVQSFKRGVKTKAQKVTLTGKSFSGQLTPSAEGLYTLELPVSSWSEGEHRLELTAQFETEAIQSEILFKKDTLIARHQQSFEPIISSEGDLVVRNDFEFLVEGEVLVEAVLYSDKGEMIGKTHHVMNVTKGERAVELNFYGLLLHDAKIQGAVELRHIQLSLVGEDLETKAIQVSPLNQKSAALDWAQFRSTPFDNPVIAEKIARLEK